MNLQLFHCTWIESATMLPFVGEQPTGKQMHKADCWTLARIETKQSMAQ